jgi:Mg/Co/Ni transporter MgtE
LNLSTPIELREIFKLAHHDIATKVIDQLSQELNGTNLGNTSIDETMEIISERVAKIYKNELKTEMTKVAEQYLSRLINANS